MHNNESTYQLYFRFGINKEQNSTKRGHYRKVPKIESIAYFNISVTKQKIEKGDT